MASSTPKTAFRDGFRDGAPMILIVVPFAVVFGILASEAGLSLGQTMGFSALVIAGASQLAAVQLMTENAALPVVIGTALAVNLRMAMYSAALVPHLGPAPYGLRMIVAYLNVDQTFALSAARYEAQPAMTTGAKLAYFFGTTVLVIPLWYGGTYAGAVAGKGLPGDLSLAFAVPIAFLAIVSLMLRTPAHWAAAGVSVSLALLLRDVPFNLGLLIAAAAAMATGAVVETRTERRG